MARVAPGSPADMAGIRPGDRIFRANGCYLRDVIDFDYYASEDPESLWLECSRGGGKRFEVELWNESGGPWGVEFAEELFDGIRTCNNNCAFCFVHQLPRGLRRSLYLKDDDFRLSFLHGSFITATNLTQTDHDRILEQRLSPLYISVHALDDSVRRRLLGNPDAPRVINVLRWLGRNFLTVHTQIVICPGINDGAVLEQTIEGLSRLGAVASVGIVPVGLTAHRRGLPDIRPVTPELAEEIIRFVQLRQPDFLEERGSRFVWASDEMYLLAGRPIPSSKNYEDYSQLENGVGIVRLWLDSVRSALRKVARNPDHWSGLSADVVTGVLAAPMMRDFAAKLVRFGVQIYVHKVRNMLFGPSVTVAGLLAGRDIAEQLGGKLKTKMLLVPGVALREGGFLDDVALDHLGRLYATVRAAGASPSDLLEALLVGTSSRGGNSKTPPRVKRYL